MSDILWKEVGNLRERVRILEYKERQRSMREVKKRLTDWPSPTEILTPKEWAIVICLILTTAAGITSPKQIIEHFLGQSELVEQH